MGSIWWLNIKIIYSERKVPILTPVAASLHLRDYPPSFSNVCQEGELFFKGTDHKGQKVYTLLHGGYYPIIINLLTSLEGRWEIVIMDDLYSFPIKLGLFLETIDKGWGWPLIQGGIEKSLPMMEKRVREVIG